MGERGKHHGRSRAACAGVLVLVLVLAAAQLRVAADTITVTTGAPEVAVNGVVVAYDGSGLLTVTGTPNFFTSTNAATGSFPFGFTPSGTFSIQARLDPLDGSLEYGTISLDGALPSGGGSLLIGRLTDFGFLADAPIFFQFAFNVTGGSMAATFGATGGSIVDAGSEDFDGTYQHAFSGEGTASVSGVGASVTPMPASLPAGLSLFVGLGVVRVLRRRRSRNA